MVKTGPIGIVTRSLLLKQRRGYFAEVALVLGITCYQAECRDLNSAVQAWQLDPGVSLDSKRAGPRVKQAIMAVADGS